MITRCFKYFEYIFVALAFGSMIVYALAVLNSFYIDPLGMFTLLTDQQTITDFTSTIGNKNLLSSYICIAMPVMIAMSVITEKTLLRAIYLIATGKKPTCFVYPFGAKNDLTEKLIKEMGFSCTLTCTEKPNIITKNPDSLYELGRYRRDRNESMQNLLIRIETQS